MSQAEVPLEWIHVFYWEMGPFIPPFAILKLKVERFKYDACGMSMREKKYMYILFI